LGLSKANKQIAESIPSLYIQPLGLSAYPQEPTPEKLRTRYMTQQINNIIDVQRWQSYLNVIYLHEYIKVLIGFYPCILFSPQ
jgi:hypothetical protein